MNFILLSRAILDSEVFASEKLLKIWIWCLCKANYCEKIVPFKTGKGQITIKIKRGQFIFGRFTAENELFIDGSTIYKAIKKLETLGNILIQSNKQYSVITICNYDYYQNIKTYKEQAGNKQVTSKEQASNTTKEETLRININISFNEFWDAYEKKVGDRAKLVKKWEVLSDTDRSEIMAYIPGYIKSQPDKKFRKNPDTFLNNHSWTDELINNSSVKTSFKPYKILQS